MDAIGDILAGVVQKSLQNREPEDYVDDEGFLCCGKCHDRKQMDVNIPALAAGGTKTIRVGCLCKCGRERAAQEKREQERRDFESRMERLRRDGITDPAYLQYTFDQDDKRNPKVSDVCRRYVDNWAEMKARNIGILFYGDVGTGKSFLACAIANALLERLVSVKDNIAFAKKFIQDALVETGVLRNDGWSEIEGFTDNFALDPKNPRVEVTIEEMEGVKRNGKRKN